MNYTYCLCESRHYMPVTESIFPHYVDPTDVSGLYAAADEFIPDDCTELTVYVTGLTIAMMAVVEVCVNRGITLTVMHYDRENMIYFPQTVMVFCTCGFCHKRMPVTSYHCPHCGAT